MSFSPATKRSLSATIGLSAFAIATLAGAASAVAAPQSDSSADEVIRLTNAERAKAGCSPLKAESHLTKAAQAHTEDMASHGFMDHNSSKGDPGDRISAAGYRAQTWAENIAQGYSSAADVVDGWMNSSGHRANILNCGLRDIGVGVAKGKGGTYWTQDFGTSTGGGSDDSDKPGKPGGDNPDKPGKPGGGGDTDQPGQPGDGGDTDQPGKPGDGGDTDQPGQPGDGGDDGGDGGGSNPWDDWFPKPGNGGDNTSNPWDDWLPKPGKPGGGKPSNPWGDWLGGWFGNQAGGNGNVSWDPWSNGFGGQGNDSDSGGEDLGQLAGQGGNWSNGPQRW
ncbi:CAP domain-containing protein [Nocardia sp. NPDC051570]|uniref:CAP domain-containing protein n=1 Tax=Nocardia sp. NPDC051570 TaxID=3364324 RepID=UPI0037B3D66F